MIKRIKIIILLLSLFYFSGYSQYWKLLRYEVLFGLGTTNLFGDIGGTPDANSLLGFKDIKIKETGPSFYVGARYKNKENQAFKLNIIYGTAKSSDQGARNESRQYSYTTTIIETSVQYEYYFLSDNRKFKTARLFNRKGMVNNFSTLSLYGFGGLGGIYFNPKTNFAGKTPTPNVEFYTDYSKVSVVFPIGLGGKMALNKFWSVGFEFGRRFSLSDYIDGFSTVFSKATDTYYFGTIHAIYKIETDRYGRPLFFGRRRTRY